MFQRSNHSERVEILPPSTSYHCITWFLNYNRSSDAILRGGHMTSTGVSDIFEILSVHVRLRWSRYAVSTSSVDIRARGSTTHRIDEIICAFL